MVKMLIITIIIIMKVMKMKVLVVLILKFIITYKFRFIDFIIVDIISFEKVVYIKQYFKAEDKDNNSLVMLPNNNCIIITHINH